MIENDFIECFISKLVNEKNWNPKCAKALAEFIEATNKNTTNCYPEFHPLWCNFIVEVYKIPKKDRPSPGDIKQLFVEQGWQWSNKPCEDSSHYMEMEYQKGLQIMDFFINDLYFSGMLNEKALEKYNEMLYKNQLY